MAASKSAVSLPTTMFECTTVAPVVLVCDSREKKSPYYKVVIKLVFLESIRHFKCLRAQCTVANDRGVNGSSEFYENLLTETQDDDFRVLDSLDFACQCGPEAEFNYEQHLSPTFVKHSGKAETLRTRTVPDPAAAMDVPEQTISFET